MHEVSINSNAFDAVPQNRRNAVIETFGNAPDGIKSIINRLSSELKTEDTREYIKDGKLVREGCQYSPSSGVIRMNPNYDDDDYAEVFRHEYGHFVDDKCCRPSSSQEFINAVNEDLADFSSDPFLKQQMLDDLFSCDAKFDHCVMDVLSGLFHNDKDITKRYGANYIDYWGHEDAYWDGVVGPQNAREKETFANLFSLYSTRDRTDSIVFLETYFPNITDAFKQLFNL